MKRKAKRINLEMIFVNIVIILFLNTSFFISNTFPKHIIEFNTYDIFNSILLTVFNFAYYAFYYFCLIVCFTKNSYFFSQKTIFDITQPFVKRYHIKRILILIIIQIGFDMLRFSLCTYLSLYSFIINDIIVVLSWIVTYIVLVKGTAKNLFYDKKKVVIAVLIIIAILALFVCFELKDIINLNNDLNKYEPFSTIVLQQSRNVDFLHGLRNMMFDIFIGVFLYVLHIKNPDDISYSSKKFSLFDLFSHIFVIFLITHLLLAIRIICCRQNVIAGFNVNGVFGGNTVNDEFGYNTSTFTISRMRETGKRAEYTFTRYNVYFNDKNIKSFNVVETPSKSTYKSYDILGCKVETFSGKEICYVENNKPVVFLLDDIDDSKEDKIQTEIFKELILDGNMYAFEKSCDYLIRYDRDFITNHIKRISNGDFYKNELQFISENHYKKNYLVDFAKNELYQLSI